MDTVACCRLRPWVRDKGRQSSARLLKRVAAPPEQLWLEALLAQILQLVEMELKRALRSSKLTPERAEMIEATGETGCEPTTRLVLRLIELHCQVDVAHLECAARVGAEDPNLAHARQVRALTTHYANKQSVNPPCRLRALHVLSPASPIAPGSAPAFHVEAAADAHDPSAPDQISHELINANERKVVALLGRLDESPGEARLRE